MAVVASVTAVPARRHVAVLQEKNVSEKMLQGQIKYAYLMAARITCFPLAGSRRLVWAAAGAVTAFIATLTT